MADISVTFPQPCSERWDEMAAHGCNRFCDRCEQVIHDLSSLTVDQAEAMLRTDAKICVRAEVDADGTVRLKPSAKGRSRRMIAAISASAGLLSPAYAAAAPAAPKGSIAGRLDSGFCMGGQVTAIAADGRRYIANYGPNGRYKIKRLPDGAYDVVAERPMAEEEWKVGRVIVANGKKTVLDGLDPESCIVVGQLMIDDGQASG